MNSDIKMNAMRQSTLGMSALRFTKPRGQLTPAKVGASLVIIRGLPGSGKSTMASVIKLLGYRHFEADMFFIDADGKYLYDSSRIRQAHAWCQSSVKDALNSGQRVVVCNTFTRIEEIEPYLAMTSDVQFLEAGGRWCNQHGVPMEKVNAMRARWEPLPLSYACSLWSAQ